MSEQTGPSNAAASPRPAPLAPPPPGALPPPSDSPPRHPPLPPSPPGPPPPFGGPPGDGDGDGGAGPPGPPRRATGARGVLLAIGIAVAVVGAGALAVLAIRASDTESSSTDRPSVGTEADAAPTDPSGSVDDASANSVARTTPADPTGSVDGAFVRIEARPELVPDEELDAILRRIAQETGDDSVSTAEPVLNLCAALVVEEPTSARVAWSRDDAVIVENPLRTLAEPADGSCVNNSGDPLENGAYEVVFTDGAGGESGVALFSVGAETRSQDFVNDTGGDICFIDLSPATAGYFQSYEPDGDTPLAVGETIVIDIADVDHDLSPIDCAGNALETRTFTPSPEPVSLSSGASAPPTTLPPPEITDDQLALVDGVIGAFVLAVEPGSAEEAALIDNLTSRGPPLPIASEETSRTLCSVWFPGGSVEADAVWEFNGADFARAPVVADDGVASSCIPPNGVAEFGEGAYQVYLERGGVRSPVQTYTVGRAQTELGFVNDTGVEVCVVGFSPTLTSFYTYFAFDDSADFDGGLLPDEAFTIAAPFIENDIQALDCDGNLVAESLGIPPTDQTLSLTTGLP